MDQAQNLRNIVKSTNKVQNKKARVITVTSGKGGVGKSSISINLAIQFRQMGKSVIIFDADFGLANIEVMFGAIPKYNLSDLVYRGKELKDIIVKGPMDIGFVSGGSGISGLGNLTRDQLVYIVYKLKELEQMADIIIIDTGAGISSSVLDFVVAASEILIVTTPEPTSITDSYSLLKALNKYNDFDKDTTKIRLVANRVSSLEEGNNLFNKLNIVVSKFLNIDLEFLGVIQNDDNMSRSVIQQKPISIAYPNSHAVREFQNLARKMLDAKVEDDEMRRGLLQILLKKITKGKGGV